MATGSSKRTKDEEKTYQEKIKYWMGVFDETIRWQKRLAEIKRIEAMSVVDRFILARQVAKEQARQGAKG